VRSLGPFGPSGVLRQRRRCNADGEVPLILSLLASLLYAADVHGFGSCPMSDWIRKATSNSARPFPRTGEIASFANFTKSTASFPALLLLSFQSLANGPPLAPGVVERTLRAVSKPDDSTMFSVLRKADQHAQYNPWRTTKLALCQRLDLRTCHRRARHRRLHPERRATRGTACHPALLYYQRVAPGVETTVWHEESGALVHITWYLENTTVHRFAALPAWLAKICTVLSG